MRWQQRYAALAAFTFGLVVMSVSALADGKDEDDGISLVIDNRMIVEVLPQSSLSEFMNAFVEEYPGATMGQLDQIPGRSIYLLEFTVPKTVDPDLLEDMVEDGFLQQIVSGELLYDNSAPEGHSGSVFVDFISDLPFAEAFENQYAVTTLGLEQAAPITTGLNTVVAVLDTGVDPTHPQFAGQVLSDGFNALSGGTDTADDGTGLMVGHGTFVTGLILRTAPATRILPVVVLDGEGKGDAWALLRGLYFAIDRGVEVINMSLGSTYESDAVEDAIDRAKSHGIITVSAAGNFNRCTPEELPAMTTSSLGIAATDEFDVKADFSNFHEELVLSAPGVSMMLRPTLADGDHAIISTVPGGEYRAWSGTSMAAPFVSGAAALIRAQHPELDCTSECDVHEMVEDHLTQAAVNIDLINPNHKGLLGAGRLDVAAAAMLGPPQPIFADLDADGLVGVWDLVRVILDWGQIHSMADLDADGLVGVGDLLTVIANWG